jgi:hypothetical protein
MPIRKLSLLCVVLLLSIGSTCNKKGGIQDALNGGAVTSGTILAAVSQARTDTDELGVVSPGTQPSGTDTDFTLTLVPGSAAITNGGTATIAASAPSAFSEIYVGVEGLSAFYQITFPAPVTSTDLLVTIDQDIDQTPINIQVSAGDGVTFGPIAGQSFDVIFVGSGDVQVSITFDQQDDVDISVTDPNGDTVFFGMLTVPSGGTLDLDANPVCTVPFGNSENITWPAGTAPEGLYSVFVDLYQSCTSGPVNYTITVSVVGSPPQIFTGTLDVGDVALPPQLVTTFTITAPGP